MLENDVEGVADTIMERVFFLFWAGEEMVAIRVSAFSTRANGRARLKWEAQFATKSREEKGRCVLEAGHMKWRGGKGQRSEVGAE